MRWNVGVKNGTISAKEALAGRPSMTSTRMHRYHRICLFTSSQLLDIYSCTLYYHPILSSSYPTTIKDTLIEVSCPHPLPLRIVEIEKYTTLNSSQRK